MKTTTITPVLAAGFITTLFTSCALDPDYRAWKAQNKGTSTANPYGAPAANTSNPYGVPQTGAATSTYTPSSSTAGSAAPYQPLPGVATPSTPSYTPSTPSYTPSTPSTSAGGTTHTVVAGDSLWGLARKYGTTVEAIQAANGLTTTNIIKGQTLSIPK